MPRKKGFGFRSARIAVCAAFLVSYFLKFAGGGLFAYFSGDDLMNMYWSMDQSLWALLRANLTFWSGSYRPLGAIFYHATYQLAGFQPFPFHAFCFVLLLVNLYLVFRVAMTLTQSREVALLTALLFAYHPAFVDLYFSSGTVYDLLCFTFYCLALLVYIHCGCWGLFCALFVLALNSKEMAVSLPLVLLGYDIAYRRPVRYWWIASAGLITVVFSVGKLVSKSPFSGHPDYTPVVTLSRYMENSSGYLGKLFYHAEWFTPAMALAASVALFGLALVLRKRALLFAAIFVVVTPLPLVFITLRSAYVLYLPMLGWALYVATIISIVRRLVTPRSSGKSMVLALQTAVFFVCALLLIRVHRSGLRHVDTSDLGWHRTLRSASVQFSALHPALPRGSRILFRNDPFGQGGYTTLFLLRLKYGDRSLEVDRVGNHPAGWQPDLSKFDLVFDFHEVF